MIRNFKNSKKGFTLIELMIVIAIIAILATVGFFAYNNIQKKARDSKRQSDLNALSVALQAYYTDNAGYPVNATVADADTVLTVPLGPYGGSIPKAPTSTLVAPNNTYRYVTDGTGTIFSLCAQLEVNAGQMWKVTSANVPGAMVANAVCTAP